MTCKKTKKEIIPKVIQEMMDDNINACINCMDFKLNETKGFIPKNKREYCLLMATCTNMDAKKEKVGRENTVSLYIFSNHSHKIPNIRKDCNYFKGDIV